MKLVHIFNRSVPNQERAKELIMRVAQKSQVRWNSRSLRKIL
jgi:hypothetical protein